MTGPFALLVREILESADLERARREINPLLQRGDNPVKRVVKHTVRARRTQSASDINRAKRAHSPAVSYAQRHGLPNLEKQLRKHVGQLPKPVRLRKKPARLKTSNKRRP